MESLKNLYVLVAVVVFTFLVSINGRTPAQWALRGVQWLTNSAPVMGHVNIPSGSGPQDAGVE